MKGRDKTDHFFQYLEAHESIRAIVFCRTKAGTSKLAEKLLKEKFDAGALHGDMSQGQRDRMMKRFKDHELSILCATDVAARGIDVNDLTHVIHYNIPENPEYYTHRAGRTARAGKKGISISFVTGADMRRLKYIQQKVRLKFKETELPKGEDLALKKVGRWAQKLNEVRIPKKMSQALLDEAELQLKDLDREEILKKLIYKEVESLLTSGQRGRTENTKRSKKDDRFDNEKKKRSKKDKSDKFASNDSVRFFINAGKMDGLDKSDLTDFIIEMAHLSKREISNIRLLKTSSYFEVPEKYAKKLPNYFRGIEIDGRALRVNRDQDPREKSSAQEFGKQKKRGVKKRGKSSRPNKKRR
ncbi:MAG: helicase-related protein [Bacteroidota bacterium]